MINLLFATLFEDAHPGAGEGTGLIDRCVQRRANGMPFILGDSIKGSLRRVAEALVRNGQATESAAKAALGAGGTEGNQGSVMPGNWEVVFFPVRTLHGRWAWITSRSQLEESLVRLLNMFDPGKASDLAQKVQALLVAYQDLGEQECVSSHFNEAEPEQRGRQFVQAQEQWRGCFDGDVILQEKPEATDVRQALHNMAGVIEGYFGESRISNNLLLVHDDIFRQLLELNMVNQDNIAIDNETNQTVHGSLRRSEHLPQDTVLVGMPSVGRSRVSGATEEDVADLFTRLMKTNFLSLAEAPSGVGFHQIGADISKSKGLVRTVLLCAPDTQAPAATGEDAG